MKQVPVEELVEAVRVTLDENQVESEYLATGTDNMELDELIRAKLAVAVRSVIEMCPSQLLDAESLDDALFIPKLLSWDEGPIEDAYGQLRWELSGDLSAVDTSDFKEETGGTELTENGEEVLLFTPKESGVVTVKVSSAGDPTKTASCRVMLLEEDPVDSITVSPVSLRLRVGRTYQLSVTLEGPEGSEAKPVFSSDNPNIATVDDNGLVLGVSSGTTVIRVRAGGEEATCKVTVWKESSGGYVGSPAEEGP